MQSTNSKVMVTLTPNEQRVYIELLNKKICSLRDVTEITDNYETSRTTMSRLVDKGYALRVHRGYYAGIPPESLNKDHQVDRYLLAHKVSEIPGALAYHTALELHGIAHSYFNTVYYLRPKSLRPFEFQDVEYRYVKTKKLFGVTEFMREGIRIPVTDRERTFLDCIRRSDHSGGMEEVLKSIATFHKLDYDLLNDYLKHFDEQSLRQKTGYILSLLEDQLHVPDDFLADLKNTVGAKTYYLTPKLKNGSGKYVSRWNLIVHKNIEELVRFA